jgi:hypothetical protein
MIVKGNNICAIVRPSLDARSHLSRRPRADAVLHFTADRAANNVVTLMQQTRRLFEPLNLGGITLE